MRMQLSNIEVEDRIIRNDGKDKHTIYLTILTLIL